MLSLVISVAIGMIIAISCHLGAGFDITWTVVTGAISSLIIQILIGLLIRKKVSSLTNTIQSCIIRGQEKVNRKAKMFQQKPIGGMKTMQKALGKELNKSLEEAIALTSTLEAWYKWSPLLKKQVATMRVQFYYQMQKFDKVDELMPGVMLFDARTVAMKMARQYKNNDPELEATFNKRVKKFKSDNAALIYALYSWILIKKGEKDKALELLIKAKGVTSNETIYNNWECLANGKEKKFSNASMGDEWYALYLETPKMKHQKTKQKRMY